MTHSHDCMIGDHARSHGPGCRDSKCDCYCHERLAMLNMSGVMLNEVIAKRMGTNVETEHLVNMDWYESLDLMGHGDQCACYGWHG